MIKTSKMSKAKTAVKAKEGVIAISTITREDLPAMLEQVIEKISALTPTKKSPSESVKGTELPGVGLIENLKTVDSVVKAHSMVSAKEKAYDEAVVNLGLKPTKYKLKLNGISATRWQDALLGVVSEIENKVQLKNLNEIKKKLEDNLSEDAKLAKAFGDIQKILASDD